MSPPRNDQITEDTSLLPNNHDPHIQRIVDFTPPTHEQSDRISSGGGIHGNSIHNDGDGDGAPVLLRHDSDFSVGTDYHDGSPNDMNALQAATLLTAECLGTGLLALPGDIQVLGFWPGMLFLVMNIPINLAAGTILCMSASIVEERQKVENRLFRAVVQSDWDEGAAQDYQALNALTAQSAFTIETTATAHTQLHHDTATYDFIGMTTALFRSNSSSNNNNGKSATRWTQIMYYTNLFLVLGNYILVMSHAVVAASGERLCLPMAGLIAAVGMFFVSQLRTMARLGRTASIVSLLALVVVVVQCLVAARSSTSSASIPAQQEQQSSSSMNHDNVIDGSDLATGNIRDGTSISQSRFLMASLRFALPSTLLLKKFSAMGSIGFAVGSQKLLLNIRHELSDRKAAPRALLYGLIAFGSVYVAIILIAGPNPPSFLFDAIPPGTWNRRVAGILLWGHVMVSYAINSQALCASLERLISRRIDWLDRSSSTSRWMILTGAMGVMAYTVANAIPFFDDLVALIGAVTSVPLTLLLPALFWRQQGHYPLWKPTWDSLPSWSLLMYATLFMLTATVGSLWSISQDWASHGPPFSCS